MKGKSLLAFVFLTGWVQTAFSASEPFLKIIYAPPANEEAFYSNPNSVPIPFFYYDEYKLYLGVSTEKPCSDLTLQTDDRFAYYPNRPIPFGESSESGRAIFADPEYTWIYSKAPWKFFSEELKEMLPPNFSFTCLKQDIKRDGKVYSTGEIKLNYDNETQTYKKINDVIVHLPSQTLLTYVAKGDTSKVQSLKGSLYVGTSCNDNDLKLILSEFTIDLNKFPFLVTATDFKLQMKIPYFTTAWTCMIYKYNYSILNPQSGVTIKKESTTGPIKLIWDEERQTYTKAEPNLVTFDLS